MKFFRPASVEEAIATLAEHVDARCLAGGQSLVAMMNADLVRPTALVSLRDLVELRGITVTSDLSVHIGAMTTHAQIAAFDGFCGSQAIVRNAARKIAHSAIRNAGTIGGSVAHADPAADFPSALLAADAQIEVAGPSGRRRIRAEQFFVDYFETARAPDEIVIAVHLPSPQENTRHHYDKLVRVDGDFAIASVAVVIGMAHGRCNYARVVGGACAATPVRASAAETLLVGSTLEDEALAEACSALAAAADPLDDFRGSAAYRRKILPRLALRGMSSIRQELRA
jgi:aerobic carbon-monoxide dehydrogenase medium subunit